MDILQEIEVVSTNILPDNVSVKPEQPDEEVVNTESKESREENNSPTTPVENQITISETGSNWKETETWWDENKTQKQTLAKDNDQKVIEDDSDDEETVNMTESEFS